MDALNYLDVLKCHIDPRSIKPFMDALNYLDVLIGAYSGGTLLFSEQE